MKPVPAHCSAIALGRAPCGARGLKPVVDDEHADVTASRPVRGAWIETGYTGRGCFAGGCRAPRGARGLKLLLPPSAHAIASSRPVRGAWIETAPRPP